MLFAEAVPVLLKAVYVSSLESGSVPTQHAAAFAIKFMSSQQLSIWLRHHSGVSGYRMSCLPNSLFYRPHADITPHQTPHETQYRRDTPPLQA